MQKIGVVTDTNACLDYFDHDHDIPVFRSIIHLGDQEYLDHIELKATDFYKKLKADASLFPRTSQPPTAKMIETYETMKAKGYTDLIVITISSHMSGIYSSAQIAAKAVENINVHVFDSRSVAFPQAKMTLLAAEMAQAGKSVADILTALKHIRANNHIFFAVDTLQYLVKNGRLSGAQGFMGSMLRIKPLLHISTEGKVENIEKIRTFKKAIQSVVERFIAETKDQKNIDAFICHAHNDAAKDQIIALLSEHDEKYKDIFTMPLTPAVGAHAGPGAIGLGYYLKD